MYNVLARVYTRDWKSMGCKQLQFPDFKLCKLEFNFSLVYNSIVFCQVCILAAAFLLIAIILVTVLGIHDWKPWSQRHQGAWFRQVFVVVQLRAAGSSL